MPSTVHPAIKIQTPHRPKPVREQFPAAVATRPPASPRELLNTRLPAVHPVPTTPKQQQWDKTAFSNSPTEVEIPIPAPAESSYRQEAFPSPFAVAEPAPTKAGPTQITLSSPQAEGPGAITAAMESFPETSPTHNKPREGYKDETNTFATLQQNPERIHATKRAAEHWRSSWMDRQRLEAGPATNVSRGQAIVDEPLNIIQQSLLRMRALMLQQTEAKQKHLTLAYYVQVVALSLTILALTGFILASYF